MNNATFNKLRVVFVLQRCNYCKKVLEFIERLNMRLPIEKRIRVINCTFWQYYEIMTDPLIALYNKYIDGFPTICIDGIRINGVNSKIEIEAYLYSLLQKDFIVNESNKYRFSKECSLDNKGRIVCN